MFRRKLDRLLLARWVLVGLSQFQDVSQESLIQKGNGFSLGWCAWDDQAQIPIGAAWLSTKAAVNRSFPNPSLGREEEARCGLPCLGCACACWAELRHCRHSSSRVSPSCALQSGWLWQHALSKPSKGKHAAGGLPGWCIAMLLATHWAIIVPYRPCRDVLNIRILCSHRLLNSHVNFSGPSGDGFHLPASLVSWAAEAILKKSFAFLGWREKSSHDHP